MTADELRNELGSLIWKTATNLVHGGKVTVSLMTIGQTNNSQNL